MLPDAGNPALAPLSRFNLAYDSAHFFALAAIRWCGYRPANRTIVFQALPHTLSFSVAKWRFLDDCHHTMMSPEVAGVPARAPLAMPEKHGLISNRDASGRADA